MHIFKAYFYDEHDSYAELNLKEKKIGFQNAEPVERAYVKYDLKNNLPTHEATIPIQRENEVKVFSSALCVTNKANEQLTTFQKELLRWHFRLGHIGFQNVQWLTHKGRLKVQRNCKALVNCERTNCASCECGKCHR